MVGSDEAKSEIPKSLYEKAVKTIMGNLKVKWLLKSMIPLFRFEASLA
jgi:hypothetical protein